MVVMVTISTCGPWGGIVFYGAWVSCPGWGASRVGVGWRGGFGLGGLFWADFGEWSEWIFDRVG